MNRMKQILLFGKIAMVALLLPLAVRAASVKKDSTVALPPETRLVLAPQAHLQLITEPIWGDSVEAIVTVAVPDSCKIQRYLCRLETNLPARFSTVPRYKWALRGDSLTVLSFLPLQIRVARQSFTPPATVKIHYQNLDHAAKLAGTATLELKLEAWPQETRPLKTDSSLSATIADSSNAIPALTRIPSSTNIDSTASASSSSSFGIFYVALAILLIFLFGGLSWLMSWSQRRRFRLIEAKTTAMAFPHLQHLHPTAPTVAEEVTPAVAAEPPHESYYRDAEAPATMATPSDLPAIVSHDRQVDWQTVLGLLQQLNQNLQQILANQHEANQRLAQMSVLATVSAPRPTNQLALFDILNEEAFLPPGERHANGNGSASHQRLQLDDDNGAASAMREATTTVPVHFEEVNDEEKLSFDPHAANLRILFANPANGNAPSGGEALPAEKSDEILLH